MPHNRGLNNKCFDDCMCAEGEPGLAPAGAGVLGGGIPHALMLVCTEPGCYLVAEARGACGEGGVGESLGSLSAFPICELI